MPKLTRCEKECRKRLRALDAEYSKYIRERLKIEDYRTQRVIQWIREGNKAPVYAFTSGNERQIAYEVDRQLNNLIDAVFGAAGKRKFPNRSPFEPWVDRVPAMLEAVRKLRKRR